MFFYFAVSKGVTEECAAQRKAPTPGKPPLTLVNPRVAAQPTVLHPPLNGHAAQRKTPFQWADFAG